MLIYNVTINIDETVHDEWLTWMRDKHVPDMLATGKFSHAKMAKVLVEEEMGGVTYSVQYTTKDRKTLEAYYKEDAERLRSDGQKLFPNKFVAFRTELEIISQQIPWSLEYLFTYGTLQDLQVQQYIFGRTLTGKSDFLSGFKKMENAVYDRYPLVVQTGNPKDTVPGMVYEATSSDLAKADIYETSAYKRKKVVLESGIEAWLYVKNSN